MKITDHAGHMAALDRILELMNLDPPENTPEHRELDELATAVDAYERKAYPELSKRFSCR